jgi:hypothetical protein
MGRLQPRIINIRGIVAETGPIGVGTPPSQPVFSSMSVMVLKHDNFINQIIALVRSEITTSSRMVTLAGIAVVRLLGG